jgi:hypothetical protein
LIEVARLTPELPDASLPDAVASVAKPFFNVV